jgi:hypothetical protein
MIGKISLSKLLQLPDALVVILFVISIVLLLSPYFAGQAFGNFTLPVLTQRQQSWLKMIGPLAVIAFVFVILPVFPNESRSNGDASTSATPGSVPTLSPTPHSATATTTLPNSSPAAITLADKCFESQFSSIPEDRRNSIEVGVEKKVIIKKDQSKEGMVGIMFRDQDDRLIGAITFHPRINAPDDVHFRIAGLYDSKCVENVTFVNVKTGANMMLNDWDQIRMTVHNHEYWLVLGYDSNEHTIKATFFDHPIR